LPKKTDFHTIDEKIIFEIEDKLNNRPRKVLGYRTPLEVMQGKLRPQKLHFGA
jgi:IS30 family transposase